MIRRRRLFLIGLVVVIVPLAAALAVSASSAASAGTLVSPPDGDVVTITVNIDAPGASRKDAKAWKEGAETTWNEAFDRLPYKCFKFHLVVNVTRQPDDFEARAGHHRIYKTNGWNGVIVDQTGDTTNPYEHSVDGAIGDLPGTGFAHETGHMMGLGDDYTSSYDANGVRQTTPKHGREHTLMADLGPIDAALINRLGDILRRAGKLPTCWTGTSHSESTRNFRGGQLVCTEVWNITFGVRVAPDGTATGTGTGNLLGQRNCHASFNWDFTTQQVTGDTFDVSGHLRGNRFELEFDEKTVAGGHSHEGLLNHTLFFPHPQPILVVPIVAPNKAEGTTTIRRTIDNGETAVGIHEVRMKCDISCQQNVG